MGVPAFFRWLSRKYPSIIVSCIENKDAKPEDFLGPNPNQIEFDNVYLDMNGIIHPCCHPEFKAAPENEDEMMVEIFNYIDRLMGILRPRKLLYMAVDGVAPRAKMNQQRSRRFRASQESVEHKACLARVKQEIRARGIDVPDSKKKGFDSNCITPGTPFMHKLSLSLRYYIQDRLSNHPAWKDVKVILSDANVPGEGEHKIMDFIRKQRANPNHDPNTRHCLCGADADLIMLGLATHEPHFTIIREEFRPQNKPCDLCGDKGHELKDCKGEALLLANSQNVESSSFDESDNDIFSPASHEGGTTFLFIRLDVLRQYLERELLYESLSPANNNNSNNSYNSYNNKFQNGRNNSEFDNFVPAYPQEVEVSPQNRKLNYDLERLIDDWIFLCFFVGNDFLPHLPSLEIRENAIDRLVKIYRAILPSLDDYLTHNGLVNLKATQSILVKLGQMEDNIFKQRQANELRFKRREAERAQRESENEQKYNAMYGNNSNSRNNMNYSQTQQVKIDNMFYPLGQQSFNKMNTNEPVKFIPNNKKTLEKKIESKYSNFLSKSNNQKISTKKTDQDSDEDENTDDVRLWEAGFKDRYYTSKFNVDVDDMEFRNKVAIAYAKGLCWVLLYYYQGCPSWDWYFPFHYAPFASDFHDIEGKITNTFDTITKPFSPLEQLMAVFPASSGVHVPPTWAQLMTAQDSPILDFYPSAFKVDLNGKKFAWQGVALLPFVDEKRLLDTLHERVYNSLTPMERELNKCSFDRLYVSNGHPAFPIIRYLLDQNKAKKKGFTTLNASFCQGMAGSVTQDSEAVGEDNFLQSPLPKLPNLTVKSIGVFYKAPSYADGFIFQATLLPNLEMPVDCLKPLNWDEKSQGRYRPPLGFGNNITVLTAPRRDIHPAGKRLMNKALQGAINHNTNLSRMGDVNETFRKQNTVERKNNNNYAWNYSDDTSPSNNNRNRYQNEQQLPYNNNNNRTTYGAGKNLMDDFTDSFSRKMPRNDPPPHLRNRTQTQQYYTGGGNLNNIPPPILPIARAILHQEQRRPFIANQLNNQPCLLNNNLRMLQQAPPMNRFNVPPPPYQQANYLSDRRRDFIGTSRPPRTNTYYGARNHPY